MDAYTPNASATISSPLQTCEGNNAMAQQGNSAAEQEKEQNQASDTNGQAVTPELNALNANNLNLGLQQNGECIPLWNNLHQILQQAIKTRLLR